MEDFQFDHPPLCLASYFPLKGLALAAPPPLRFGISNNHPQGSIDASWIHPKIWIHVCPQIFLKLPNIEHSVNVLVKLQ